jgi:hypothetical protein
VNLIYFIIFVYKKPLSTNPSKKITQPTPSSYATLVAPSTGVTGSTALFAAEAWDFCRRIVEFLEGLKNRDDDHQVTHLLLHYFFLLISLTDLWPSLFAVLANDLKATQKTLSDDKFV